MRYFLIPKSRDLISHNSGILGLKNGPFCRSARIRLSDRQTDRQKRLSKTVQLHHCMHTARAARCNVDQDPSFRHDGGPTRAFLN